MSWFLQLWIGANTATRVALAVALVALVLGLVYLGYSAQDIADWLSGH